PKHRQRSRCSWWWSMYRLARQTLQQSYQKSAPVSCAQACRFSSVNADQGKLRNRCWHYDLLERALAACPYHSRQLRFPDLARTDPRAVDTIRLPRLPLLFIATGGTQISPRLCTHRL